MTLNQRKLSDSARRVLSKLEVEEAELARQIAERRRARAMIEETDFERRLGDLRRSQMTTAEKVETISRVGEARYLEIDW